MIPVVSRPTPKVPGATVTCEPKGRPYLVNRGSGYSNPDMRWRWTCSVCPFTCEDREKEACEAQIDAHNCPYGWCSIPMTPARVALLGRPHIAEPTKEDRQRWARQRELNAIAARTANRVVDLPRRDRA